jgi:hypothetical protein
MTISPAHGTLVCPRCNRQLTPPLQRGENLCGRCETTFELELFDPPQPRAVTQLRLEESADARPVCGNHARNVATESCSRCGMFICSVCAIHSDGTTFCPACYERLSAEGALESTRTRFRDASGLASTLAVGGIVIWFLAPIFGLGAVIYGIRAIRQSRELQTGSGCSIAFAIIVGLLEVAGGVFLIVALFGAFK